MKRKISYKQCIRWIAENDDNEVLTSDGPIMPLVTESMVSHLFDVPEETVRQEVVREIIKAQNDSVND